jgi:hypothetical protein
LFFYHRCSILNLIYWIFICFPFPDTDGNLKKVIDSWSYEPIFFNGYYQTYNQCEYYIVESGARWIWGTVVAIIVCGGWIYNYGKHAFLTNNHCLVGLVGLNKYFSYVVTVEETGENHRTVASRFPVLCCRKAIHKKVLTTPENLKQQRKWTPRTLMNWDYI